MGRIQNFLGLFFLTLFLAGCQGTPHLVKRSQMLMGTVVFVTAVGADERIAQRAAKAGLDEIRRLEELLSTWIPTSELSQVNAAAGRESIQVSQETFDVLMQSLKMAELTQGAFNIALGPAVNAWNVSGEGQVPPQEDLEALRPQIELSNVQLDETTRSVWLRRPGMSIDVGGIGKGYAADLAVKVMRTTGATAGVVALSGDIKTFGRMPDAQRFVFGIQHPRKEQGEVLGRIELEDEAVSTAGDYQRYFMRDGVRFHHILDPQTLHPARGCQSVTIIAKEGVMADGLDTGIFVMGPDQGMALIESLPDVEGVIVDQEGTVLVSSGLKNRVSLEP
ncbi:MAG: FAD:protein FMN transferase [Nitrospirales bacterium]|nr:FAD:protein FMN transferase [Nitrospirales bacterium]